MKNVIYFIFVSLMVFTSCKKSSNPISSGDETATVTYEGKVYHTVKIGNQTWLKENLDVGTMIQGTANPSNNGVIEKYCYGNDTANCTKYGGLYQWNEAMAYDTTNGAKGICPTGWHVPTKAEFDTLATAVRNNSNSLKAIGQGTGSGAGTDSSGFSVLLAGYYVNNANFNDMEFYGYFWSSTVENDTSYSNEYSYNMFMNNYNSSLNSYITRKLYSFSVRCLKN